MGSHAENKGSSEEGAERSNLDTVSVRKADGVTPLPSTTVYVTFMFKGSKGEHPRLVCEKMLLNSFQAACDGAERASEHAQDIVWRR